MVLKVPRSFLTVAVFVIAAVAAGCFWIGRQNDEETLDYVNWVVPDVLTSPDTKFFRSQSSKELLAKFPPKKMESMFKMISFMLGPMKKYDGAKGVTRFLTPPQNGMTEIAQYDAHVEFAKGPGIVHFGAVKRDGKWQITSFFVQPE